MKFFLTARPPAPGPELCGSGPTCLFKTGPALRVEAEQWEPGTKHGWNVATTPPRGVVSRRGVLPELLRGRIGGRGWSGRDFGALSFPSRLGPRQGEASQQGFSPCFSGNLCMPRV